VGSSLQAEIVIEAPKAALAELGRLGDDLKFVFITSQATAKEGVELKVMVAPSTAVKCERAGITAATSARMQITPASARVASAICTERARRGRLRNDFLGTTFSWNP